jgi:hypothetical protein
MFNMDDLEQARKQAAADSGMTVEELDEQLNTARQNDLVIRTFIEHHGGRTQAYGEEHEDWLSSEILRFEQTIEAVAQENGLQMSQAISLIAVQDEPFYSTVSTRLTAAQHTPKYDLPAEPLVRLTERYKKLVRRSQALSGIGSFTILKTERASKNLTAALITCTAEYQLNEHLLTMAQEVHQLLTATQAFPTDWVEDMIQDTELTPEFAIQCAMQTLERTLSRMEEVLLVPEDLLAPQLKLLGQLLQVTEELEKLSRFDAEGDDDQSFDLQFIKTTTEIIEAVFFLMLQLELTPEEPIIEPGSNGSLDLKFSFQNKGLQLNFKPTTESAEMICCQGQQVLSTEIVDDVESLKKGLFWLMENST